MSVLFFPQLAQITEYSPAPMGEAEAQSAVELASKLRAGEAELTPDAFALLLQAYTAGYAAFSAMQYDLAALADETRAQIAASAQSAAKLISYTDLQLELARLLTKPYGNASKYPDAQWQKESVLGSIGGKTLYLCGKADGDALVRVDGNSDVVPLYTLTKSGNDRVLYASDAMGAASAE